jgi:hypothetical protein
MLAKYFAGAVALQFVLGIFDFLGTRYFDGAFDIVFALIGFCAIKNSDGHSYQQVICYMFLNGFNFVWSILRLILNLAGVRGFKGPSEGWRSDFYMITIGAGPAVYLACTVVAYLLYKELKAILYAEMGQMEGGASGGGAVRVSHCPCSPSPLTRLSLDLISPPFLSSSFVSISSPWAALAATLAARRPRAAPLHAVATGPPPAGTPSAAVRMRRLAAATSCTHPPAAPSAPRPARPQRLRAAAVARASRHLEGTDAVFFFVVFVFHLLL